MNKVKRMTEVQRRHKIIGLICEADRLLGEALRLGAHKNNQFGSAIVDAQILLDDAQVYLDRKQTLLTFRK